MTRDDDLAAFRRFVDESRWRFARTYVTTYPHEYTLARWGDACGFREAVLCIERWGVEESFLGTCRRYLHDGDRKYWHMGDAFADAPAERPDLINRAWLDVSRYRGEAQSLGYEGERLDRLVDRWGHLLARATRGPEDDGQAAE